MPIVPSKFNPSKFISSANGTSKSTIDFIETLSLPDQGGMSIVQKVKILGKWHLIKRLKPKYSNDIGKSKKILDSIFQNAHNDLTNFLPVSDSFFSFRMGDKIFSDFIEKVKTFDKEPSKRNRKLVLLDIKNECFKNINDSIHLHFLNFNKGSVVFYKLNNLFAIHSNYSRKKIDSLIYKE
jgi:hypothetical protein